MRIGLYGIYGVYNFGCEAIIRGADQFFRNIYPDAHIIYYSYNYQYDKRALNDTNVDVRDIVVNKSFGKRVLNKISTVLNFDKRILFFDCNEMFNEIDLVVSIGGDIYTIPQYMRSKQKYPYYNQLVDFCDRAIRLNKKVVVYGASVGPFGDYKKAIKYYVDNMRKYSLIICREEKTIEYLRSIGLSKSVFFPDPAFQVKGIEGTSKKKKYIGVNLSPLSIKELYGKSNDDSIKKMAVILDKLYEKTKIDMMFLPHVVSKDADDNDLMFMSSIKEKMKYCDHVFIADTNEGFLGIKVQLQECIVVASARMHCAINAMVESVPTIFLAYSQKSVGMCEYVYGSTKWVVDLKEIDSKLIPSIVKMLDEKDSITGYLKNRNEEIFRYYEENIENIKKII